MPCCDAMTKNVVTVKPDETVANAINILYKNNIRSIPVVDDAGVVIGVFSFSNLLKKLLPVSVTLDEEMTHGHDMNISLEHFIGETPWVEKRLKARLPQKVEDLMIKEPATVHPDSPLGEGIRLIVEYGSPLAVVEEDSGKLVGIISSQNILEALQNMMEKIDNGEEINE